jgi:hypothetical protein
LKPLLCVLLTVFCCDRLLVVSQNHVLAFTQRPILIRILKDMGCMAKANCPLKTLNSSSSCTDFHHEYLSCDAAGDVTLLHVGNRGLTGTVSTELALLTKLTKMILGTNSLHGTIPPLPSKLTFLNLDTNKFSGIFHDPLFVSNVLKFIFCMIGQLPPIPAGLTKQMSVF